VLEACKDSLKKLQLDYLDLYLIHFPVATRHTGKFLALCSLHNN
jgi:diketogulonate reductase-like aldo/keto reductase